MWHGLETKLWIASPVSRWSKMKRMSPFCPSSGWAAKTPPQIHIPVFLEYSAFSCRLFKKLPVRNGLDNDTIRLSFSFVITVFLVISFTPVGLSVQQILKQRDLNFVGTFHLAGERVIHIEEWQHVRPAKLISQVARNDTRLQPALASANVCAKYFRCHYIKYFTNRVLWMFCFCLTDYIHSFFSPSPTESCDTGEHVLTVSQTMAWQGF